MFSLVIATGFMTEFTQRTADMAPLWPSVTSLPSLVLQSVGSCHIRVLEKHCLIGSLPVAHSRAQLRVSFSHGTLCGCGVQERPECVTWWIPCPAFLDP